MEAGADSVALEPAGDRTRLTALARRRRRCRGTGRRRRPGRRAATAGIQRDAPRGRRLGTALAGAVRPDPRFGKDLDRAKLARTARPACRGRPTGPGPGIRHRQPREHAADPSGAGKNRKSRGPRAGLRLRLGYIGHRRRQARRRRRCRGGHRSAGARYDNRECANQRRKPARRAAGTAACGNLRLGPCQHPCRSPDLSRGPARGAHAYGWPRPAFGDPAIPGRRGGQRRTCATSKHR